MWVFKKCNDAGKDFGQYQVGWIEYFGNDGSFWHVIHTYKDGDIAARVVNYLNGGTGAAIVGNPTFIRPVY
jgi:hypothetical protein